METKNILTKEGLKELTIEMQNLIDIERPKVIEEIKEARAQGDLSENAEFDAAREHQGQIEDRIAEIERIISTSTVINSKSNAKTVAIGSTITIEMNKEKNKYQIVGALEANPFDGKISNVSPLGIAVLGKKVGDEISYNVELNGSKKKKTVKIKAISN